ncbi:MAG: hypothetical protein RLZZ22_477 [Pseudomonadota bacterium]|jgi:hypothetical protein
MRLTSTSVRWLGLLAFAYLNVAGAQVPPRPLLAELPIDAMAPNLPPGLAPSFEQAWDVVELAGQPTLIDSQRPARVVLRPQGVLWVDGGCNYFSGRVERNAQGLFRVSKYGGTHGGCDTPPRSEAFLNSALMMVDNFRWDRGLLLRSGSSELLRLRPSTDQDTYSLEQGLARRAMPAPASALQPGQARQLGSQECRPPVKARKVAAKSRKAQKAVCSPAQLKAFKAQAGKAQAGKAQAGKSSLRAVGAKSAKPAKVGKSSLQSGKARRVKAGPAVKGSGKKSAQTARKRHRS